MIADTPVNYYIYQNIGLIKLWQMGSVDKHTFLSNMSIIVVHFQDLVRLRSHQKQTVPEFTQTIPQTTS